MDIFFVLLLYLEAVNLIAFIAMGVDKHRARVHRWRIPEATLLGLAAIGGSVGAIGGMLLFRHKTQKPAFRYGLPGILTAQILIALSIIYILTPL